MLFCLMNGDGFDKNLAEFPFEGGEWFVVIGKMVGFSYDNNSEDSVVVYVKQGDLSLLWFRVPGSLGDLSSLCVDLI